MSDICASITVAGLGGDSGKTLVALGLAAGWTKQGLRVAPFKKGPDYIDAAWLTLAAGTPCRNLDTFLMEDDAIRRTWEYSCERSDICVVEGNRGLFDGMDAHGSHSTAELAKRLNSPVLLVLDATKKTATLAAFVLGVQQFDPSVPLAGVVLNQVGGSRHEQVARQAIETHTDVRVVGAIPRVKGGGELLPGRHLGLITVEEHPKAQAAIDRARELVTGHVDLDTLVAVKQASDSALNVVLLPKTPLSSIPDPPGPERPRPVQHGVSTPAPEHVRPTYRPMSPATGPVRIAVVRDSAFSFYYPENLEALRRGGADLVTVNSLEDTSLPDDIHALYIGGGFPETHARRIGENRAFLDAVRQDAENGLPVYAECGGLMLLCESIEFGGERTPMAGVFPHRVVWSKKPAGHGYAMGEIRGINPFYPVGTKLRGHEFHHSHLALGDEAELVLELKRGTGVKDKLDGLTRKNVLALYTHIHAAGTVEWADGMLSAARHFRDL